MIGESEYFYGAALLKLFAGADRALSAKMLSDQGVFILDSKVAVMPKYSTSRMSPWSFTLTPAQNTAFFELAKQHASFLALICNDDGIACISAEEIKSITHADGSAQAIRVGRGRRSMYKVSGPAGPLKYKVGLRDFESKVLSALEHANQ